MKSRILIYEGIPGSGKSTLRYEIGLRSNFKDLTIDRFSPTQWVFSKLREDNLVFLGSQVEEIMEKEFDVIVIWCICSPETAFKRCREKNDSINSTLLELERAEELYRMYFRKFSRFTNIVGIDTENSISETVDTLMFKLFEEEYV